jgi:hypothetical protein
VVTTKALTVVDAVMPEVKGMLDAGTVLENITTGELAAGGWLCGRVVRVEHGVNDMHDTPSYQNVGIDYPSSVYEYCVVFNSNVKLCTV